MRSDALRKIASLMGLTSIEICAGAGGQALGLEQAGFEHLAVVELDRHACATLRRNRPYWNTLQGDLRDWRVIRYREKVDLFAGGVPCPPFSKAGKQLGGDDERDLFPTALRLIRECQPRAILLENVRGLLDDRFAPYRDDLSAKLLEEGYIARWKLHHASDYGVPQLRPRTLLVALRPEVDRHFSWPKTDPTSTPTVGEALYELMAEGGWKGAAKWAAGAARIAPTLVGGSHKHGGPDLGPTRARREWERLGVNGKILAAEAPAPGFRGAPPLTVAMTAVLQGFPREWEFMGKKTNAYRQIGNAFPPPVARAVGLKIAQALRAASREARRADSSIVVAA